MSSTRSLGKYILVILIIKMESTWNHLNRLQNDNDVIIHALNYDLSPNSNYSPNHNLIVYADTIRIDGIISLPGKNIYLHARQISCSETGVVDLSGKDAPNLEQPRAQDGQVPGEGGKDGTEGKPGQNAGNATIIAGSIEGELRIRAVGGKGGKGQDGGLGAPGAAGSPGANGNNRVNKTSPGFPGGQGGKGGKAGRRGRGGPGGNGGKIAIFTLDIKKSSIITELNPGMGGPPGELGSAGKGGPGGPGGMGYTEKYKSTNIDGYYYVVETGLAPTGSQGFDGDPDPSINEPDPVVYGVTGAEWPVKQIKTKKIVDLIFNSSNYVPFAQTNTTSFISSISPTFIGKTSSIFQILIALHQAKMDYLNADSEKCSEILQWIELISREKPGSLTPKFGNFGSPYNLKYDKLSEWSNVSEQVTILLNRISAGLDFYGYPRDFVPLVSTEIYTDLERDLIAVATDIEVAYNKYWKEGQEVQIKRESISKSIDATRGLIEEAGNEINIIANDFDNVQNEVQKLTRELVEQNLAFVNAEDNFKRAVERQSPDGCSLVDVIAFVSVIVTVSGSAIKGIKGVIGGVKTLAKVNSLKEVVATIKTVSNNVQEIQSAYSKIRDKVREITSNEAKIAITLQDFEKALEPYLNLPEARDYRYRIRSFVETSKARNQKALDYTALLLRKTEIETLILQHQNELNRLTTLQADFNPNIIECAVFMGRLLDQVKQDLLRTLYHHHKALEYWSLEESDFNVDDRDIASIKSTFGRLRRREIDAIEIRNGANLTFENPEWIEITEDDYPNAFINFRKTGTITFSISQDNPAFEFPWTAITVKDVDIDIPNVRTEDDILSLILTHSGIAHFIDTNGKIIIFSHLPRRTVITYKISNGKKFTAGDGTPDNLRGEKGKYAFLSPFTTWTLSIDKSDEPDLTNVNKIRLKFKGFFLPRMSG